MTDKTPWAHIAHRSGVWAGVISASLGDHVAQAQAAKWKKQVARDLGKWIADGWEIRTVYSREEYQATLDTMRMYDADVDGPKALQEQPSLL